MPTRRLPRAGAVRSAMAEDIQTTLNGRKRIRSGFAEICNNSAHRGFEYTAIPVLASSKSERPTRFCVMDSTIAWESILWWSCENIQIVFCGI